MDRSEVVRKLMIVAERNGYITFDELNALIPDPTAEDVEAILMALSDRDVWIAEE
jgi:Sigma-70 factor, region 1.1